MSRHEHLTATTLAAYAERCRRQKAAARARAGIVIIMDDPIAEHPRVVGMQRRDWYEPNPRVIVNDPIADDLYRQAYEAAQAPCAPAGLRNWFWKRVMRGCTEPQS